jgi:hypothetical protein
MKMDRRIGLYFSSSRKSSGKENESSKSLNDAIKEVARNLFPNWDMVTKRDIQEGVWPELTIAIADAFYGKGNDAPIRWLESIKKQNSKCVTILAFTLPESDGDLKETENEYIDHFITLAASNVNAWDEITNLLKQVENSLIHLHSESSSENDLDRFLKLLRNGKCNPKENENHGNKEFSIVIDEDCISLDEGDKTTLTKEIINHLATNGISLKRKLMFSRFILRNIKSIKKIDLRACYFINEFVIENCVVDHRSSINSNTFCAVANIVNTKFNSDIEFNKNFFDPLDEVNNAGLNSETHDVFGKTPNSIPIAKNEFSGGKLPWFCNVRVLGEFSFRLNTFHSRPIVDGITSSQSPVMFNKCEFMDRFYVLLSEPPAKLAFYHCIFADGCETDISFPYISRCDKERTNHLDRIDKRFQSEGELLYRPEVRFSFCHISSPIRIHEFPTPISNLTTRLIGNVEIPKYDPKKGIGINLTGSTLSGCLDLSRVRIAWINAEKMIVCGGFLVTHHDSLTTLHLGDIEHRNIFVYITKLKMKELYVYLQVLFQRVFLVAPQRVNFVFDEKTISCEEPERFSSYFRQSNRLEEISVKGLRDFEQAHRIATQYESLRMAYSNGPNTYSEEDFCQFKRLYWLSRAEISVLKLRDLFFALAAFFSSILFALFVTWMFWLLTKQSFQDHLYDWFGYSFLVVFVFLTLGFRSVKRVARVVVAFLYRNLLGYLLYPVRVIASTGLIILFFGFLFTAINYLDTEFRFGNIVPTYENSVTPSPDPVRRSSIASCVYEFPRMVYFSCVTFTTLGYGDERPTGIARPFANLEALVGAVWLSFITVSVLRHVTRK